MLDKEETLAGKLMGVIQNLWLLLYTNTVWFDWVVETSSLRQQSTEVILLNQCKCGAPL